MKNIIMIECPTEILLGLHLDIDKYINQIKKETAFRLYSE